MVADVVLESVSIASLAATLAIFLLQVVPRERNRPGGSLDFGIAFSAFVAGWMITELLEAVAPSDWSGAVEILHFAVLASFAVWMNARWRWSLRRAREAT